MTSKKPETRLLEFLLKNAPEIHEYDSARPLLEQIIENIFLESVASAQDAADLIGELLTSFVDWNEVRIVAPERLLPHFEGVANGDYKIKAMQAFLNKIFSRSGSLDYQFLLEFDLGGLEDYLSGVMEFREKTRKLILLRVFRMPVLPYTIDHEKMLEKIGVEISMGDERVRKEYLQYTTLQLEGMLRVLEQMKGEFNASEGAVDPDWPYHGFHTEKRD